MTDKELDDLEARLRGNGGKMLAKYDDIASETENSANEKTRFDYIEGRSSDDMLSAADAIAELREKNAGLVGALQEASGIIGIDAAAPRVNHALSRYTAFMEAE